MTDYTIHPASYKDPAGFIFLRDKNLYRQVNLSFAADYDLLMQGGLYERLTAAQLLIPHTEITGNLSGISDCYKTLQPQEIVFTSYAYEWSFDMLKDAALLTLHVNKLAMQYGMILKDATPFNVQFHQGKPIFIDTLSFEKYNPDKPWIAYRQFCEMFLFPLYFEYYLKTDINKILTTYIDGIPVDLTARLLPLKSSFNMGVWLHVHLQNTVKRNKKDNTGAAKFDSVKLNYLLDHLETILHSFKPNRSASAWSNYYQETILSENYLQHKEKLVGEFLQGLKINTCVDLGANDGHFSLLLAKACRQVTAVDSDSQVINKLYRDIRKKEINNILPLCIDLVNPSPAIGFNNRERQPFLQRAHSDLVVALALIHHLVFTKNIRLDLLADFFSGITNTFLLIEFIPLDDEKVKKLLSAKTAVHLPYDETCFESVFEEYFVIEKKKKIASSNRTLYLMKKINHQA